MILLFSIVAPHFEYSVTVVRLHNFIFSVLSQHHWSWELLVIHEMVLEKLKYNCH